MLTNILTLTMGIAGILLTSYGTWLYQPPLGYIVAGLWLILFSGIYARAKSVREYRQKAAHQPEGQ